MKRLKKIGLLLLFLAMAGVATYLVSQAGQGRKLSQMIADDESAWDIFTDVGLTATVEEANLLNMGTDAVSDTGLHLQYITDRLDWAVTNSTVRKVIFTKPPDMTVKVINIFVGIDSCATLADTAGTLSFSFLRFDASDTTWDSLLVANSIRVDDPPTYTGAHQLINPTMANGTLDDGDQIQVAAVCSNHAITTQPRINVTIELYIKPE